MTHAAAFLRHFGLGVMLVAVLVLTLQASRASPAGVADCLHHEAGTAVSIQQASVAVSSEPASDHGHCKCAGKAICGCVACTAAVLSLPPLVHVPSTPSRRLTPAPVSGDEGIDREGLSRPPKVRRPTEA